MRVYNTYTCVQEKCAHTHLHHDGHEQLNGQLERGRVARGAVAQQRDAQRLAQVQREHRAHVLPAVLRIVQYLDQQLQRQQLALRARHTPHAAAAYCVTDAASTRKGRALGRASAQPVCVCVCVCGVMKGRCKQVLRRGTRCTHAAGACTAHATFRQAACGVMHATPTGDAWCTLVHTAGGKLCWQQVSRALRHIDTHTSLSQRGAISNRPPPHESVGVPLISGWQACRLS